MIYLQAFLDVLEQMCHSSASLRMLRTCQPYSSFLRRWNVSVYFSLLFQSVAGGFACAHNMSALVGGGSILQVDLLIYKINV
jgi:hypothetical protein